MNKKIIKQALQEAYSLIDGEVGAVEYGELRAEYLEVLERLELALQEIQKDEKK